jgi:hypothetical protein
LDGAFSLFHGKILPMFSEYKQFGVVRLIGTFGVVLTLCVGSLPAQEAKSNRVHIIAFSTDVENRQTTVAARTASNTMALTLRLLGGYAVTEDVSFAWASPDECRRPRSFLPVSRNIMNPIPS